MKRILFSAMLLILASAWPLMAAGGIRGDVNGDGAVNIGDVTALIDYLLADSSETVPVAADVDGNGIVSIADVTVLVDGLLAGAWHDEPAVVTEELSVKGVAFTMTLVKAGTFTMGATAEQIDEASHNEFPAHQVTITYDFYIGQTEVTQELWLAVMGRNPSEFQGDLQRPVENVTRFDCAIFVDKLTELTGRVFRMPTEAEWEFAARGGNLCQGRTGMLVMMLNHRLIPLAPNRVTPLFIGAVHGSTMHQGAGSLLGEAAALMKRIILSV